MTMYLGIDYGRKHLGLALAEAKLATPYRSLDREADPLQELATLVTKEQITTIVCGLPEGQLVPEITAFARALEAATHVPVVLHPETLSTKEAIAALRAVGGKRKKLQNDHVYAACLILEDYLDTHPES
jgi:putative transcription antitermination factor YqgF